MVEKNWLGMALERPELGKPVEGSTDREVAGPLMPSTPQNERREARDQRFRAVRQGLPYRLAGEPHTSGSGGGSSSHSSGWRTRRSSKRAIFSRQRRWIVPDAPLRCLARTICVMPAG